MPWTMLRAANLDIGGSRIAILLQWRAAGPSTCRMGRRNIAILTCIASRSVVSGFTGLHWLRVSRTAGRIGTPKLGDIQVAPFNINLAISRLGSIWLTITLDFDRLLIA